MIGEVIQFILKLNKMNNIVKVHAVQHTLQLGQVIQQCNNTEPI